LLALRLAKAGHDVVLSVATEFGKEVAEIALPDMPGLFVTTGRLNAEQMAAAFTEGSYDHIIDATHPYAVIVTENIKAATESIGASYLRLIRPAAESSSELSYVPDMQAAAELLQADSGKVMLTIGSKELDPFTAIENYAARCFVRILPMPESLNKALELGFRASQIICMQGPFDFEINLAMLRAAQVDYMVTKDSGDIGGFADKVNAALELGIKVIVVSRPTHETGYEFEQLVALLAGDEALSADEAKAQKGTFHIGTAAEHSGSEHSAAAHRETEHSAQSPGVVPAAGASAVASPGTPTDAIPGASADAFFRVLPDPCTPAPATATQSSELSAEGAPSHPAQPEHRSQTTQPAHRLHQSQLEQPSPIAAASTPPFFPLFVSLEGRQVLFIGGGAVNERRVKTALGFGAKITIISPQITDELAELVATKAIEHHVRAYSTGDIARYAPFMVVAATDSREINAQVRDEAARLGVFASIADARDECSFYFPAIAESATLVAGLVSKDGDHRAVSRMAAKIREVLKT
jgi:precorrin-6x reductase